MIDRNQKALSLLEVLVAVVVVAIISALVVMKFLFVIERARAVEALKILRELKDFQIMHKYTYGEYAGDGNINEFPKLAGNVEELEHFTDIIVTTDPLNVCKIYRSDNTYHLNITDLGVIYCEVDSGFWDICNKLGFKDVNFREITEVDKI